jgi:hypothetical protein
MPSGLVSKSHVASSSESPRKLGQMGRGGGNCISTSPSLDEVSEMPPAAWSQTGGLACQAPAIAANGDGCSFLSQVVGPGRQGRDQRPERQVRQGGARLPGSLGPEIARPVTSQSRPTREWGGAVSNPIQRHGHCGNKTRSSLNKRPRHETSTKVHGHWPGFRQCSEDRETGTVKYCQSTDPRPRASTDGTEHDHTC